MKYLVALSALLALSCSEIINKNVDRQVDLTNHYTEVKADIDVEVTNGESTYEYLRTCGTTEHVAYATLTVNNQPQTVRTEGDSVFIPLPPNQKKYRVKVFELYKRRKLPFPKKVDLKGEQLVKIDFFENLCYLSNIYLFI